MPRKKKMIHVVAESELISLDIKIPETGSVRFLKKLRDNYADFYTKRFIDKSNFPKLKIKTEIL